MIAISDVRSEAARLREALARTEESHRESYKRWMATIEARDAEVERLKRLLKQRGNYGDGHASDPARECDSPIGTPHSEAMLRRKVERLRATLQVIARLDIDGVTGLPQEPSGNAAVRIAKAAIADSPPSDRTAQREGIVSGSDDMSEANLESVWRYHGAEESDTRAAGFLEDLTPSEVPRGSNTERCLWSIAYSLLAITQELGRISIALGAPVPPFEQAIADPPSSDRTALPPE